MVVRAMIVALIQVERDNIGCLAKDIDLLKDQHALEASAGFQQNRQASLAHLSRQSTTTGTKSARAYPIFYAPSKTMDVVANTVAEKVFGTTSLDAIFDIQSDLLKPLADAILNTKLACICETES